MTDATEAEKGSKRKVGRSPSYPFISVQKALEKAQALHSQEGEYAAPLASAVSSWGYSPKSSGGRQTLATMKYYGLIDITGEGDGRKIKVSDTARRILLDKREDDTERRQLIRKVALTPAVHKALYDEYPNGLASDGSVEHFLIFEQGFNAEAAKEVLAEFKETARHIRLYDPAADLDKGDKIGHDDNGKNEIPVVKVGDRIQCTIAGVDTFPNGATVIGFSEDGQWVFTDQSDSGSPLKDVSIMEVASPPAAPAPPAMPAHLAAMRQKDDAEKPGTRRAVFPIDEGDVTLIFPEGLSPSGLQDLGDYLDIFLKKEAKKKREENTAELLGKAGNLDL